MRLPLEGFPVDPEAQTFLAVKDADEACHLEMNEGLPLKEEIGRCSNQHFSGDML